MSLKNAINNTLQKIFKDFSNTYLWLKNHCRKRFLDWFFSWKYYHVDDGRCSRIQEFKKYYLNKDSYQNLTKNLDQDSIHLINRYFNVIVMGLWNNNLCLPKLNISNNPLNKQITWNIKAYKKDFYFPYKDLWFEVFFYKHWINYIPNIETYVKWKDIIDCWAFIWDSALMFDKELNINKIFCCEPENKNYEILLKTIEKNYKQNKIIPLKIWVWLKKWEVKFDWWKTCASRISNQWKMTIKIDSIDNITKENNILPWLIKRDVEWAEYESILWAKETIKKYKPILLISIYHTPRDFFEIKPLIESWNLGYNFKIVHCGEPTNIYEIMLLGYLE